MLKNQGSIWRRWDFHVHTPYSFLNNQFGSYKEKKVWDKYIYNLFTKAISNSIGAIFVTDYYIIDGYKKIKEIMHDKKRMEDIFSDEIQKDKDYLKKVESINIFPNIELRLETNINKGNKVQYHILFSNELDVDYIKTHFVDLLSFEMDGTHYYCKISELEKLGKRCIEKGIANQKNDSAIIVGFKSFAVDLGKAIKLLQNDKDFSGKYIFVAVEEDMNDLSWNSQGGPLRERLYNVAKARFSSNQKDIEWGFGEDCLETIGHPLPCIFGSDSHDINSLFYSKDERYCWVKADTTFKGLLDALECAKDRIYIGPEPQQLIKERERSAFSIKSISVSSKTEDGKKHWINEDIDLNPSMISIIGNKGSGKSALSDIIALLGNSSRYNDFSFLNSHRFFNKNNPFSNDYQGTITFSNGNSTGNIDILPTYYDNSSPERVTYLPQSYIEKTCNIVEKKHFINEIDKIIFSYLDDIEKNGFNALKDLIVNKFSYIDDEIDDVRNKISKINSELIEKEKKKTVEYKRQLSISKKEIEAKLENHILNKPLPVDAPKVEGDNRLVALMNEVASFLQSVENEHRNDLIKYKEKDAEYCSVLEIERNYNTLNKTTSLLNESFKEHFEKYNPNLSVDVSLTFRNLDEYTEYKNNLTRELNSLKSKLIRAEDSKYSFNLETITIDEVKAKTNAVANYFIKEENLRSLIQLLAKSVSDEQAAYQKYQTDLKEWEKTKELFEKGDENDSSIISLASLEKEKQYIENKLSDEINELKCLRKNEITKLYSLFKQKNEGLKLLYEPVQNQLDDIMNENGDKIAFDSRIVASKNLSKTIDDMINHRISSCFKDFSELETRVINTDFDKEEDAIGFIDYILEKANNEIDSFYGNLLKEEGGQLAFYNFLTSFQYLSIQYSLKMNDKPLEQLSPGEKGIALLVFYLALDKNPKPLIIDQPEDNLDNQSIFMRLTSLIKIAKQNRQIIVVTHNPNIAVACDSEQIIYASIEQGSNIIHYESGSIENPVIAKHIVDVLEGTMPAFDFRTQKYSNHNDKK